jgi:hypothetical protein
MGERLNGIQEVRGSIPLGSTNPEISALGGGIRAAHRPADHFFAVADPIFSRVLLTRRMRYRQMDLSMVVCGSLLPVSSRWHWKQ